mmetsp:Transcript_120996/g.347655  ORF Transcript_120996/g.347655 Transcript_120996/m.347655 type:complete len:266 (+) Transcript_120996:2003-2800(+)
MVGGVLGDVTNELRDLDVVLQLLLEAAIQNLALRRLETVHDRGHGAGGVVLRELDELFVDEVVVGQVILGMVHVHTLVVGIDPVLPIVGALLVEGQVDSLAVVVVVPAEGKLVVLDVLEIFLGLFSRARAQAFVVLALPTLPAVSPLLPLLVLRHREEAPLVPALGVLLALLPDLDNGRDELLQEAVQLQERRPPMMHQINQQTLDVRAVVVLIRHDHDGAVAQSTGGVVLALDVQAHDFEQILNLRIARHLLVVGVSDVQHFAA